MHSIEMKWILMCLYVSVVMVSSLSYASSILWLLDRLQAKVAVWLQYILYKFPFIYNALVAMNKLFYIDNLINLCLNVMGFFYFQLHVLISCSTFLPLWKKSLSNHYQIFYKSYLILNILISIVQSNSKNHNSLSQTLKAIQVVGTNHWYH